MVPRLPGKKVKYVMNILRLYLRLLSVVLTVRIELTEYVQNGRHDKRKHGKDTYP